ncbi:molybdopterin-dependent oxidoreductase, partial [Achromobacter sp. GG226]|uniref:molybdopterin oxidoreductase family protein n=1 Tax=Verticiella alkaliphila TaxID=2779529 RepID=UPI001C0DCAE2
RDPGNAAHRAEVAALWGVPALPDAPGLPALQLFEAIRDGRIKAVWIAATNPAQSLPDQARVRAALEAAELVIVQEAFAGTETLAYADIVLPAATWPEKDGTVTNSERRVSRVHAAIAPPGDAQGDWQIVAAVARALAARIAPELVPTFTYADADAVFAEHTRTTAGRDLDYSGLSYATLAQQGPQQWPYPAGARQGTPRLYGDGIFATADGRARFLPVTYRAVAEPVSEAFPWRLTTGRLRDHWHTMARTGLAPALTRHVEEPALSLHPDDLDGLGLGPAALVRVTSARGTLIVPVQPDAGLRAGQAFLPMHWGSAFLNGDGINALTNPARDPVSHQPELKHTAVAITPAALPWQAVGWARGDAVAWRARLRPWLSHPSLGYASVLPVAMSGESGVRIRFASAQPLPPGQLRELAQALGLTTPDASFEDTGRGRLRRLARRDGRLDAYLLAGDTRAADPLDAWADG